jgi:mannose-1-phosphate guanylyltransferase
LRPITDTIPKCMIPIGDRTLLDIWLDALDEVGVEQVLVNIHHLAPVVRAHVLARGGPPEVVLFEEPELLGSAGTLLANRAFVAGEEMFLAINADNLTDFDLGVLVDAHRRGGALATIAVFAAPRPSECGIVEVDDGRIVSYVEKPEHPVGNLANAGMYAFSPGVLDLIDATPPCDIGFHLLPQLVDRGRAVSIGGSRLIDIGTPAALELARTEWHARSAR